MLSRAAKLAASSIKLSSAERKNYSVLFKLDNTDQLLLEIQTLSFLTKWWSNLNESWIVTSIEYRQDYMYKVHPTRMNIQCSSDSCTH